MMRKDLKKHRKNNVQNPKEHLVHITTAGKMQVYTTNWRQNYLLNLLDMTSWKWNLK